MGPWGPTLVFRGRSPYPRLAPTNARMEDTRDRPYESDETGRPTVSTDALGEVPDRDPLDRRAPAEAFQTLANEVRVAVLLKLFRAERTGEPPPSFSALQRAAGSDSSAGFAYHLRQLTDHFIREEAEGYVLTPAGRRAAETIVSGAFTGGQDPSKAS